MVSAFGSLLVDGAEWERGSDWFERLPFNTKYDVSQDLLAEDFRWKSWFETRPTTSFMEGIEAAHIAWNDKRSGSQGAGLSGLRIGKQSALEIRFARKSLDEEHKAIRDYATRIRRTKDARLRKILKHAMKEEHEHAALLVGWLRGR